MFLRLTSMTGLEIAFFVFLVLFFLLLADPANLGEVLFLGESVHVVGFGLRIRLRGLDRPVAFAASPSLRRSLWSGLLLPLGRRRLRLEGRVALRTAQWSPRARTRYRTSDKPPYRSPPAGLLNPNGRTGQRPCPSPARPAYPDGAKTAHPGDVMSKLAINFGVLLVLLGVAPRRLHLRGSPSGTPQSDGVHPGDLRRAPASSAASIARNDKLRMHAMHLCGPGRTRRLRHAALHGDQEARRPAKSIIARPSADKSRWASSAASSSPCASVRSSPPAERKSSESA